MQLERLPGLTRSQRKSESPPLQASPLPARADWVPPFLRALEERFGAESLRQGLESAHCTGLQAPRWMRPGAPEATWLVRFLLDPAVDRTVQEAWLAQGFLQDDPGWLTRLLERERAQVARIFLVTGNLFDYAFDPVRGYRPLRALLMDALLQEKELVLTVSLSRGLQCYPADSGESLPPNVRGLLEPGGFNLEQPLSGQLCSLFDTLRRWLESEPDRLRGVAVVLENLALMIPGDLSDLERNFLVDSLLSWSQTMLHSPHCLVLTAEFPEEVPDPLRSRAGQLDQVEVPRPSDPLERLKFLLALLSPQSAMQETRSARLRSGICLEGYPGSWVERLRLLSHDTAGLTLMGIEDLVQEAASTPGCLLARDRVAEAKRRRLQEESGGLLEVLAPTRRLTAVAGYEAVRRRLGEVIHALRYSHDPLVRSTVPMGIMFLGPPGTGKTLTAEALAAESGVSLARLGDFRGMYVGQSERNLSRLLAVIQSLHPVIVFMDELDQSEGTRGDGGDSGVSRRIFARLLQFMGDTSHRGQILWIAASNRPDLVDAAMKRAGRFDLVLPFLLPDQESRVAIFSACLAARLDRIDLTAADLERVAGATQGFSGAEIEALAGEIVRRAVQSPGPPRVGHEQVEAVLSTYAPPCHHQHYRRMEDLALAEVSDLSLLSPEQRERCLGLRRPRC